MNEEENKAYQDFAEMLKKNRRANETPEQGEANFEKFIKDTATSDKSKKMREKVNVELENIPDWPEPQNELRMIYNDRRMHSLGKKAERKQTAMEVLEECISFLKKDYPDFQFLYDEDFFNKCG